MDTISLLGEWFFVAIMLKGQIENFLYDLKCIDGESLHITRYQEGEFYNWHNDAGLATQFKPTGVGNDKDKLTQDYVPQMTEHVRKLSFSLQLSDPDDYEGGNVVLLDEAGRRYVAPRQRGTIVLFDSRTQHRVCKVRKGVRKSIVGWVVENLVGSEVCIKWSKVNLFHKSIATQGHFGQIIKNLIQTDI